MNNKKVFVTVGTTKFDQLITTITQNDVLQELNKKGYNQLTLQIGTSSIQPDCSPRCGFTSIDAFHLSPSIREHFLSADLVISHAGAGSCLEALDFNKPLIVVINDNLMENHQLELAEKLGNEGYLHYCSCKNLIKIIKHMDVTKLKYFNIDKSQAIAKSVDELMGF